MNCTRSLDGVSLYKGVVRHLLFLLPPEKSHNLVLWLLKRWMARKTLQLLSPSYNVRDPRLHVKIAGLDFPSPIGLAAGFDKNCQVLPQMVALGFGYIVGGTVMLSAQPGNPSPRLIRLSKDKSLMNSLGFPSQGVAGIRENLEKLGVLSRPLVVSVSGSNFSDLVTCYRAIEPLVDAVELNISSPNTSALKAYQDQSVFSKLLGEVNSFRKKPLFTKLPAYSTPQDRELVLGLARIAREHGVDGITAPNTRPVPTHLLAMGKGGLSGRSVTEDTLRTVHDMRRELGKDVAINATGGIFEAEDAYRALEAGADTVQIYTSLIYEGPGVVAKINRGLLRLIDESGVGSVAKLTRQNTPPTE
jgi:dihydroorotate dehydrogenase